MQIKNSWQLLLPSAISFFFTDSMSYAQEVPDNEASHYYLNVLWPSVSLDAQHPPYIYDYEPNNPVSKATFNINFLYPINRICNDTDSSIFNCFWPRRNRFRDNTTNNNVYNAFTSTGFFIETERDDNLVCALTAAHNVAVPLGLDSYQTFDIKNMNIPDKSILALNYRRVNPYSEEVSFFGNFIPENTIKVVRAINNDRINPGEDPAKFYNDLALLLIDTSSLKGRTMISKLPVQFSAAGSYLPTGNLMIKGHPFGWPLNQGVVHTIAQFPNHYAVALFTNEAMTAGSSGGPAAFGNGNNAVDGIIVREASNQTHQGVLASLLTPLLQDIEETCKQSKKPKYVYKTSTIDPISVFVKGFTQPGKNRDVVAHVSGTSCQGAAVDTAFISTTASQKVAYDQALAYASAYPNKDIYIYRIRADEKFYNAKESLQDSMQHYGNKLDSVLAFTKVGFEKEYLFLDDLTYQGIPSENIENAFLFKQENGHIHHKQINNKNFKQANTTSSKFSYIGPQSVSNNISLMTKTGNVSSNGSCFMPDSIPNIDKQVLTEVILNTKLLHDEL